MGFDIGSFVGELMKALGGIFAIFNVPTDTGQGLLKIVEFFGMLGENLVKLFSGLFGGLAG